MGFIPEMQGCLIHKSINMTCHINKTKIKNAHLNRYKKRIWQNLPSIYDKNIQQNGYRGDVFQHNKPIYDRPTGKIILNGEKLNAFPVGSGTRQECPLLADNSVFFD